MSIIYVRNTQNRHRFVHHVMKIHERDLTQVDQALIKPNIASGEGYPTTTHPDTLRSTLSYLARLGKKCVVADGPAFDAGSSSKIIDRHLLKEVCNQFHVPLINLCNHGMVTRKTSRGFSLKLSEIPAEAIYGIAEINVIARPDLFVEDAVHTILKAQEVRHGGEPAPVGQMMAGKDPVALDAYGLTLLQQLSEKLAGRDVDSISYIKLAEEYGLGKIRYELKNV